MVAGTRWNQKSSSITSSPSLGAYGRNAVLVSGKIVASLQSRSWRFRNPSPRVPGSRARQPPARCGSRNLLDSGGPTARGTRGSAWGMVRRRPPSVVPAIIRQFTLPRHLSHPLDYRLYSPAQGEIPPPIHLALRRRRICRSLYVTVARLSRRSAHQSVELD